MKIKPGFTNTNIEFFYINLDQNFDTSISKGFRIKKANLMDYILSILGKRPELSLLRHIKRGDDYFIAKSGGRIASIGRICYKETDEIELNQKEASLISFLTVPDFRRRGLYTSLITAMLDYLKREKYVKCYIWADSENIASINGIKKAGFIPLKIS